VKLGGAEDLGSTILLGPPSKEEVKSQLRTGIPHSKLTLATQKEKATTQCECGV